MDELNYTGTWRSWRNPNTREFDGPEVNGNTLAYSTQTKPKKLEGLKKTKVKEKKS